MTGEAAAALASTNTGASASDAAAIRLWQPTAAALWSAVFSPAFGTAIQYLNWRALGEPERARSARRWFIATLLGFAIAYGIARGKPAPGQAFEDAGFPLLGFFFWAAWFQLEGRLQGKYLKERFGSGREYQKRGWGRPLLLAFVLMVSYFQFLARPH